MHLRAERPTDIGKIRTLNLRTFETSIEADIVDALRQQAASLVSLVADDEGSIVGHILFSPVTLLPYPYVPIMRLAPMAVVPERQRQGIGSALIRDGFEHCRSIGVAAVIVVGYPRYYARFGFKSASRFHLTSEQEERDDVVMVLELHRGILDGKVGTIRYHSAFALV